MKKSEIPELMCLVSCFGFIGLMFPNILWWKPVDSNILFMPLYFGLFLFLLCICCVNGRKNDELKIRIMNLEQHSKPGIEYE